MDEQRDPNTPEIGRRRLLRRAGGVAAGVAGATVVGAAVMPQAASAASGDPLTIGVATNDAGTNGTTLTTNSGSAGTLELSNTNVTPATFPNTTKTVDAVGAPLRLVPAAAPAPTDTNPQVLAWNEAGSVGFTHDGTLWLCAKQDTIDWVYTTFTANLMVPITPTRILDTRSSAGSASILDATGNVDSQGRVLPGHAITVDLSSLVFFGTAVYANLTVVTPAASGFASLVPGNQAIVGEPATSNVNFVAGDVVPNFALTAIAQTTGSTDAVKIFTTSLAHIVLDVFAFTVNDPGQVNPKILPSVMTGSGKAMAAGQSRAEQARTRKPTWSK